ncbi:peptide chain release factor N(5)-glutamine methyltransferase [Pseudooceanicola onchidii]|uniref:peptide chain release factor N(5)-glutamine methyltransferase n=1 Tax=Pseudooceanicola onchidii TaxID=2562279 RepID=UPI0010AA900F|nr:peptide chain release factor N(5)-glutamine methyltransferase [Pseudooceanicola onchidii]
MILSDAVARLTKAGVADPRGDARRLFDWAYALGQAAGPSQDRDAPNAVTQAAFDDAIARRADRQPVSQITGRRAFWRHDFDVTPDVLDPRPDTETLVEQALAVPFDRVLDLGTGTGCIVISLLADRITATGMAVDASDAALTVARGNADRIGVADRLDLRLSDWFTHVTGQFDLIVSNPPYIALEEMPGLAPEVARWEPRLALTDEGDGLGAYRIIAGHVMAHLTPGGWLMVEIGPTQAAGVADLFRAAGFDTVQVHRDIDQRDRVVTGQRPA